MSTSDDTRLIPLYGRKDGVSFIRAHATVDASDYEELAQYRWHLAVGQYAGRKTPRPDDYLMYMHRQIVGLEKGDKRQVDHINQDKLDNRRANLRVGTKTQNSQNVRSLRGAVSGYRGVKRNPVGNWSATYSTLHIGCYSTEIEAAIAAAKYRHEHVEFAVEDQELLDAPEPQKLPLYRLQKRRAA